MTAPTRFPGSHRPIPRAIAYPADYALATAAQALIHDYGRDGAINRLIEMAEWVEAGRDPLEFALRRRRIEPSSLRARKA